MKFSSTLTTSFDPNESNSKRATAGYIFSVFRRLFCSNSLPTYPTNQITEKASNKCEIDHHSLNDKEMIIEVEPQTPGLMARLMGLETMPVIEFSNSQIVPNSITRSRSMNSVEYLQECEEMKRGKHRRVKSSVSFRELPTFLEQENDEFFVLNFENRGKTRSKRKIEGQETRKKVPIEKENMINMVYDKRCQHVDGQCEDQKEVFDAENLTREIKNMSPVKKLGPDTGSEESSPVSVFDFEEFLFDLDAPKSDEDPRLKDTNSRRKLTLDPENYEQPSSNSTDKTSTKDEKESKKKDAQKKNNVNKWKHICKLAEEGVNEANWRYRDMEKLETIEDISEGFERQILHQLLNELVNQLL